MSAASSTMAQRRSHADAAGRSVSTSRISQATTSPASAVSSIRETPGDGADKTPITAAWLNSSAATRMRSTAASKLRPTPPSTRERRRIPESAVASATPAGADSSKPNSALPNRAGTIWPRSSGCKMSTSGTAVATIDRIIATIVKCGGTHALEIQDGHEIVVMEHRHADLRHRAGHRLDVVRKGVHVVEEDRLARRGHFADHAAAERAAVAGVNLGRLRARHRLADECRAIGVHHDQRDELPLEFTSQRVGDALHHRTQLEIGRRDACDLVDGLELKLHGMIVLEGRPPLLRWRGVSRAVARRTDGRPPVERLRDDDDPD